MIYQCSVRRGLLAVLAVALLFGAAWAAPKPPTRSAAAAPAGGMQMRWLFIWRNMSDPKEVDRMLARFSRAEADGYNGVAFAYNIPKEKAAALKQAAAQHHLDLIAIVMGGAHDRN